MTVFALISALQYWQKIRIVRTNDFNQNKELYEGTKSDLTESMTEELFSVLQMNVLVISVKNDVMTIMAEDKYYWRSDDGTYTT